MKLKKICCRCGDRKGAAMEMAIMMIVVVLSLSILILTTALMQHSKQLKSVERMQQTVELEQIGNDFLENKNKSADALEADLESRFPAYNIDINGQNMVVYEKDTETVLMTVQIEDGKITRWNKN